MFFCCIFLYIRCHLLSAESAFDLHFYSVFCMSAVSQEVNTVIKTIEKMSEKSIKNYILILINFEVHFWCIFGRFFEHLGVFFGAF